MMVENQISPESEEINVQPIIDRYTKLQQETQRYKE
jgi:hypothetical protein